MIFDAHGRRIRCLRISVTDRCNLRCIYCMPEHGIRLSDSEHILTYEEIERVAGIAASLGVGFIRLTGGEPLARREICSLVKRLSRIPGLTDLSLTTNGTLLGSLAGSLQEAGIKRVNISLDTLDEGRFGRLTRGGDVSCVLSGIHTALNAGLQPVKINVVLFADENGEPPEDDILGFAEMGRTLPVHVRFVDGSCLLHDGEVHLREPVRPGATDAEIAALFLRAVHQKPASYSPEAASSASMSWIGG